MTRVLKIGIEPEWLNNKQIFHLYNIHGIMHGRHFTYMVPATWYTRMHAI